VRKSLTRPVAYGALYLVGMLPTYVLPYLGSNASLLRASARSTGVRDTSRPGLFAVHLALLLGLCALAYLRGAAGRRWLVVLPVLALVFDLTPGLSLVPLVPTVMHLLAITLGVAVAERPAHRA
jgi:O-antigen ligase